MTRREEPASRRRGDSGAAMIEFAFVGVLLVLIMLGIINYGLILSFKQDMTRAAAEGARAGAVAMTGENEDGEAHAWAEAEEATKEAVDGFGRTCNSGDGMVCNVNLHECDDPVAKDMASDPASTGDCVTVELVYNYAEHPLLAKPPILSGLLPDTIRDRSVARLNQ